MKQLKRLQRLRDDASSALQRGDLAGAKRALGEICRTDARDSRAWFFLCAVHGTLGEYDQAVRCGRRAASLTPNDPDIQFNLANALHGNGQMREALEAVFRSLRLRPAFAGAQLLAGHILFTLGDNDAAIDAYRKALELDPDQPEILFQAISLLNQEGRIEEAQRLIDARPENGSPQTIAARASLLATVGQYDQAYELIRPLLGQSEKSLAVGSTFARFCRRVDATDEAIDYLDATLRQGGLEGEAEATVHYSLADLHDHLGQFDRAFGAATTANAIKRRLVGDAGYRPARFERFVDQLIDATGDDPFARATNRSTKPLFIVGMPRSGTSLVEQVLASHSKVCGAGELTDLGDIAGAFSELSGVAEGYPRGLAHLTQPQADRLAARYLERLDTLAPDAERVTDKMPPNFLHVGLIARLFPAAGIIHTRRDPLDTCLSIYFQNFNASYAYGYDLTDLGHYYRQYRRLLDHWRRHPAIPLAEIDYETVVSEGEPELRRLVGMAGLEWEEACGEFHRSRRIVRTASHEQVRQPLHTRSKERWRNYASHLAPLIEALDGTE